MAQTHNHNASQRPRREHATRGHTRNGSAQNALRRTRTHSRVCVRGYRGASQIANREIAMYSFDCARDMNYYNIYIIYIYIIIIYITILLKNIYIIIIIKYILIIIIIIIIYIYTIRARMYITLNRKTIWIIRLYRIIFHRILYLIGYHISSDIFLIGYNLLDRILNLIGK